MIVTVRDTSCAAAIIIVSANNINLSAKMFRALALLASLVSVAAFAPAARTNARSSLKVILTYADSPFKLQVIPRDSN